mmetsp:Transcript_25837/g.55601  ORF Transcript_25837/g.55601 Transcript_25837/m.55601 type:complete len:85 (+) Transcript_25837:1671-1925(+)
MLLFFQQPKDVSPSPNNNTLPAKAGMGRRRSIKYKYESSGNAHLPSIQLSALEGGNHSAAKRFDVSEALLARIGMIKRCHQWSA